jgi:hypothetical protein
MRTLTLKRKSVAVANLLHVLDGHLKHTKSILHNGNQTRKKSFLKKIDFYDCKQTHLALDFLQNLFKKISRFFFKKIIFF